MSHRTNKVIGPEIFVTPVNNEISKMSACKKTLFENQSAWFSNSAKLKWENTWIENGGTVESVGSAMFLFVLDSSEMEVRKIFRSPAYINEHLAVFRADYISECIKHGNMRKVCIGKFQISCGDIKEELEVKDKRGREWIERQSPSIKCDGYLKVSDLPKAHGKITQLSLDNFDFNTVEKC